MVETLPRSKRSLSELVQQQQQQQQQKQSSKSQAWCEAGRKTQQIYNSQEYRRTQLTGTRRLSTHESVKAIRRKVKREWE